MRRFFTFEACARQTIGKRVTVCEKLAETFERRTQSLVLEIERVRSVTADIVCSDTREQSCLCNFKCVTRWIELAALAEFLQRV